MTATPHALDLTRRERQIMQVIYRKGSATAAEVQAAIADAPSYSGVRTLLRVLVDKAQLRVERDGARYVYKPCTTTGEVRRTALRDVVRTFFGGSREEAMLALLSDRDNDMDSATEKRLRALIASARDRKSK